jgi:long-chain fatty acid transport protein
LGIYQTWQDLLSDVRIPFNWDDCLRVGFGAERFLSERFTLRGGYMFDQSPIPDETFSPLFLDTGDKHCFNAGIKFILNDQVSFDASFQAVLFGSRDISQLEDVNGDAFIDNFGGEFKNKSFYSTWALNYAF